jgi:hypothetical protein
MGKIDSRGILGLFWLCFLFGAIGEKHLSFGFSLFKFFSLDSFVLLDIKNVLFKLPLFGCVIHGWFGNLYITPTLYRRVFYAVL